MSPQTPITVDRWTEKMKSQLPYFSVYTRSLTTEYDTQSTNSSSCSIVFIDVIGLIYEISMLKILISYLETFRYQTTPMIMANDRQSMISYSCLIVTMALHFQLRDIDDVNFSIQRPLWPLPDRPMVRGPH